MYQQELNYVHRYQWPEVGKQLQIPCMQYVLEHRSKQVEQQYQPDLTHSILPSPILLGGSLSISQPKA